MDLPTRTLCFATSPTSLTWSAADDLCFDGYRAGLCSLADLRMAVCRAGATISGRTWTSDPAADGSFISMAACSVDAVAARPATTALPAACCVSWPTY